MSLKPIAVVIPEDKFRDEELFEPIEVWKAAGIPVTLVSTRKGLITGDLGGQAQASALIEELKVEDYSAISIIGGSGTVAHLWGHAGLIGKIQDFSAAKKPTTAICAGAITLAQAGLLKGKTATTYPVELMTKALEAEGAIYRQDGVIVHGEVITASGPAEAADFGRAVTAALSR